MSAAHSSCVTYRPYACCACQVETGSAITWKYPSVVLKGDNSVGEFYSVALTNNKQQVGGQVVRGEATGGGSDAVAVSCNRLCACNSCSRLLQRWQGQTTRLQGAQPSEPHDSQTPDSDPHATACTDKESACPVAQSSPCLPYCACRLTRAPRWCTLARTRGHASSARASPRATRSMRTAGLCRCSPRRQAHATTVSATRCSLGTRQAQTPTLTYRCMLGRV